MKRLRRAQVKKWIKRGLCAYLVLALLCNILPYLRPKWVDEEWKATVGKVDFYADGDGSDRIALLESPQEALGARLEVIRQAQETVDIVYHTVQTGESTDAFWGEVLQAADRGVQVRVLIDSKAAAMEVGAIRSVKVLAAHPNITCREYLPIHLLKPWQWQILLHDKFILVDGEFLILGGRNLGDRFYAPDRFEGAVTNDRDVLVWRTGAVENSVLLQVQDYMEEIWDSSQAAPLRMRMKEDKRKSTHQRLMDASVEFEQENPRYYQDTLADYLDRTVATRQILLLANPLNGGKKEPRLAWQMAQLTLEAEESVLVQTPYATANKMLLRYMGEIEENCGLTVVTNSLASSPNFPAYSNYYSQRKKFLATGAEIFEYQSTDSIHGKSIVVDGRISAVGSLNMDDRSFYLDTETMLVVDSEEFAEILTAAIEDLQAQSLQVNPQSNRYSPGEAPEFPVSRVKKTGMWVTSIFSRLFQFLI